MNEAINEINEIIEETTEAEIENVEDTVIPENAPTDVLQQPEGSNNFDEPKDDTEPTNEDDTSDALKLRNEIERLKALLEEKEAEQAKILNELGEFNRLFPNIALSEIPSPVWNKVESGLPLSAAYALYEKEESVRQYKANSINSKNASLSAGSIGDRPDGEYYSPDEVKKMSQKEVHEHFSKIKKSMKYWR